MSTNAYRMLVAELRGLAAHPQYALIRDELLSGALAIEALKSETVMLRGALKAICRTPMTPRSGRTGQVNRMREIVDAALCPHKWRTVLNEAPGNPPDTSVVCAKCGVDKYEFEKLIGVEE